MKNSSEGNTDNIETKKLSGIKLPIKGIKDDISEIFESKNKSFEVAGEKVFYPDIVQKLLDGITFEEFKNIILKERKKIDENEQDNNPISFKIKNDNIIIIINHKDIGLKFSITFYRNEDKIEIKNGISLEYFRKYNENYNMLLSILHYIENLNKKSIKSKSDFTRIILKNSLFLKKSSDKDSLNNEGGKEKLEIGEKQTGELEEQNGGKTKKGGKSRKKGKEIDLEIIDKELKKINNKLDIILKNNLKNNDIIDELREYQKFLIESIKTYENNGNIKKIEEIIKIFKKLKKAKEVIGENVILIKKFIKDKSNNFKK